MNSNARGIHESPNVYTREVDISSYTSKALGVTTLGLVGETLIGPAFQPIPISTYKEFQTYFGGTNPEKYKNGYPKYELSYIAKSYLQQSQQLYVTRVLGLSGYRFDGLWALTIGEGTDKNLFAVLRSKARYDSESYEAEVSAIHISASVKTGITSVDVSFDIIATHTGGTYTYNVCLDPSKKNYILKVLGSTVDGSSTSKIFVEEMYEGVVANYVKNNGTFRTDTKLFISQKQSNFNDYKEHFKYAETPWFVSEVKGNQVVPLFRFITLSDGENANNMFKVSIRNIDINSLKFDVIVRAIYDTDAKPVILEQFNNCTLDPNDGNNYLGAQIGTTDEVYKLRSKYIMVEISEDEKVRESVPMGFNGYPCKDLSDLSDVSGITTPSLNYNLTYEDTGSVSAKKPFFGLGDIVDVDMFTFKGLSGLTYTKGFHLETTGFTDNIYETLIGTTYIDYVKEDKKLMKFTAYFAGGFDGWDIFRENRTNKNDWQFNNYKGGSGTIGNSVNDNFKSFGDGGLSSGYNGIPDVPVATGITSDFYAFWSAVRAFADPEFVDINVLATPGIDWLNNEILVNEIIDMVENERKDCIYIVTTADKKEGVGESKSEMYSASQIVSDLEDSSIDSNYVATYYPWCQYYDTENGVYLYLPPTRDVVKSIAYTDNTAYAWFPPAGLGRGSLDCVKARKSLVLSEEDTLYSGRINFIKTFALDGVKIWGQKTLQIADTALNRIGTRRMMLYLRKEVRRSNLPLIFEPNDSTTKSRFLEIVNPILNSVKSNRGISDYKILIDDSAEAKARHEMNVQIWVKPIGALEYINIDFMITPEGFDFSNL